MCNGCGRRCDYCQLNIHKSCRSKCNWCGNHVCCDCRIKCHYDHEYTTCCVKCGDKCWICQKQACICSREYDHYCWICFAKIPSVTCYDCDKDHNKVHLAHTNK